MSSRRDRIRAKIMSRVRIEPVTGCWEWTGPVSGKKGRGKELDHACRNRLCVRNRITSRWSPARKTPSAGNRQSAA